mmetsp:Transcript_6958/g.12906  ORF Transcript_6958/g.12906 Transcript_6958/m.12906 type:complete len:249 (-) Transcript_6958:664-1410(-)
MSSRLDRAVVTPLYFSRNSDSSSTWCHHCVVPPHTNSSPSSVTATATHPDRATEVTRLPHRLAVLAEHTLWLKGLYRSSVRGSSTAMSTPTFRSSSFFAPSSSLPMSAKKLLPGTTRPSQSLAMSSNPVNGQFLVLRPSFASAENCSNAPVPNVYTCPARSKEVRSSSKDLRLAWLESFRFSLRIFCHRLYWSASASACLSFSSSSSRIFAMIVSSWPRVENLGYLTSRSSSSFFTLQTFSQICLNSS